MDVRCPYRIREKCCGGKSWRCSVHPNRMQVVEKSHPMCFSPAYVVCRLFKEQFENAALQVKKGFKKLSPYQKRIEIVRMMLERGPEPNICPFISIVKTGCCGKTQRFCIAPENRVGITPKQIQEVGTHPHYLTCKVFTNVIKNV